MLSSNDSLHRATKIRNSRTRGSHSASTFARSATPKLLASASVMVVLGLVAATVGGVTSAFAAASSPSLGVAGSYAVLAATTVTSDGVGINVYGDLGVAPGTSVTGPITIMQGWSRQPIDSAAEAHTAANFAYDNLAAQSPNNSSAAVVNLGGKTLSPGVYHATAFTLMADERLVLDAKGDPHAVFVIQTDESLTTFERSRVELRNDAAAGNVFWQIGSSATLGTYSTMVGTIIAHTSITSNSGAETTGRLIALGAAVTLNGGADGRGWVKLPGVATTADADESIDPETANGDSAAVPDGDAEASSPEAPLITSGTRPDGVVGTKHPEIYITATGYPEPTFKISIGRLPTGLTLNGVTGLIRGTPTVVGTYVYKISARNGVGANATQWQSIRISASSVMENPLSPTASARGSSAAGITTEAAGVGATLVDSAQNGCVVEEVPTANIRAGLGSLSGYGLSSSEQSSVITADYSTNHANDSCNQTTFAAANSALTQVPHLPVVTLLLLLLGFLARGAFIMIAKKRRPDGVFDFQI